ncbi:Meiosis-specific APC/C activator protein AMA1 [Tolypocladium capitatum]|uniref:Meiosis-specific APC/C activator protein AMA1 n=1 Tax=Tolypocladium capitatum TaxID=45235 RepID=A0A2K3QD82_9HYPO|nr:Meiosis-specific APC/C activator protein AMA1 [Tolypocladium capitatum]
MATGVFVALERKSSSINRPSSAHPTRATDLSTTASQKHPPRHGPDSLLHWMARDLGTSRSWRQRARGVEYTESAARGAAASCCLPPVSHPQDRRRCILLATLTPIVGTAGARAPSTERYQTAKQPRSLSSFERLVRHGVVSTDPFSPRPRTTTAIVPPLDVASTLATHSRPRGGGGLSSSSRNHHQGLTLLLVGTGTTILSATRPRHQEGERQASHSTVWTVGGLAVSGTAVDDGHGHLLRRGTNARLFTMSSLVARPSAQDDLESYHGRVASALEIDRVRKILDFNLHLPIPPCVSMQSSRGPATPKKATWNGNEWPDIEKRNRALPVVTWELQRSLTISQSPRVPLVLDAPNLRDDYYCSILAYSTTCLTLAVGLGNVLYTWSEVAGVRTVNGAQVDNVWLTSVAFSSPPGNKNILAAGRSDGSLILKSIYDRLPRFEVQQPYSVTCLDWRPVCVLRPSRNPLNPGVTEVSRDTWPGSMSLMAKISLHSQQICGLAWSSDGQLLASGGNDNLCYLLGVDEILGQTRGINPNSRRGILIAGQALAAGNMRNREIGSEQAIHGPSESGTRTMEDGTEVWTVRTSPDNIRNLGSGCERQLWVHRAAVKAIAFCPWRDGLVATGGGSNDKCIHFFHASSGSALATIAVAAQVTSLIWSTTRREIAATFGYAQPEHPYRVAVFSWPDCQQVAAIPSRKGTATSEGCIVVASSDKTVKFHEVWSTEQRTAVAGSGMLGGSDILEDLEGIMKEGDVIR